MKAWEGGDLYFGSEQGRRRRCMDGWLVYKRKQRCGHEIWRGSRWTDGSSRSIGGEEGEERGEEEEQRWGSHVVDWCQHQRIAKW